MFAITAIATCTRTVGAAAAIALGETMELDAPIIGTSMNLERSFGPALAFSTRNSFWTYVVGALMGGTTGVFAYEFVRGPRVKPDSQLVSAKGDDPPDGERAVRLSA